MKYFFTEIKKLLIKSFIMYKSSKRWDKMSEEEKNFTEAKDVYYEVAEEVNNSLKMFCNYKYL